MACKAVACVSLRSARAQVSVAGSNFVFYGMALVVGYAIFSNAQGKPPDQVPVLSDAATMQIGPF